MIHKVKTSLDRWGNSLGVRLPKAIAESAALREGDSVEISFEDSAVIIRRAKPQYTLEELVAGITPENRHAEAGWGPAVGRERFWDDE
jgi:antitoxin MazE